MNTSTRARTDWIPFSIVISVWFKTFPSHHSPRLIRARIHRILTIADCHRSPDTFLPSIVKSLRPVCSTAAAPSSCKAWSLVCYVLFGRRRFHCLGLGSITPQHQNSRIFGTATSVTTYNKNIVFFLNTYSLQRLCFGIFHFYFRVAVIWEQDVTI